MGLGNKVGATSTATEFTEGATSTATEDTEWGREEKQHTHEAGRSGEEMRATTAGQGEWEWRSRWSLSRMLTHADVYTRTLTYADVC
jgi:hypothetical protein